MEYVKIGLGVIAGLFLLLFLWAGIKLVNSWDPSSPTPGGGYAAWQGGAQRAGVYSGGQQIRPQQRSNWTQDNRPGVPNSCNISCDNGRSVIATKVPTPTTLRECNAWQVMYAPYYCGR